MKKAAQKIEAVLSRNITLGGEGQEYAPRPATEKSTYHKRSTNDWAEFQGEKLMRGWYGIRIFKGTEFQCLAKGN